MKAQQLEQQAKKTTDQNKAKQLYLDAAEEYLKLSKQDKKQEKQFLEKATALYLKAQEITPVQVQEMDFALQKKPEVTFQDVGGLQELKEEISLKIIQPMLHPFIFHHYGKKIGGGILLYGPPGCGKSLIAEATAAEANATFFHVKSSDLKSKYVGETEKNIAALFEQARKMQPSVIFFDEFESLGSDRTDAPDHQKNAVAQLLTEVNGMGTKNDQILLMAATNEPWAIDPALKREGRFGQQILVPHPDIVSRAQIFALFLRDKPAADDVDVRYLAKATEGYSGADIKAVVNKATDNVLQKYFKTKYLHDIKQQDLFDAIEETRSSILPWYKKARDVIGKRNEEEFYEELLVSSQKIVA